MFESYTRSFFKESAFLSSQIEVNAEQKLKHKMVWFSFGKIFLLSAILAVCATSGAFWINSYLPLSGWLVRIFQILGATIEVTSLGQMGWKIQTWDGETPAEKLNSRLHTWFTLTGFSLLVFSYQLEVH